MRIGLISREYPPFHGGGIGTYARRFSHELATRGHRVVVVTVSDDGEEHRERVDDVDVVRLPFIAGGDWSRPAPAIDSPEVHAAFHDLCPTAALSMVIRDRLEGLVDEFGLDVLEFPDTGALAWFTLNSRLLGEISTPPIVVCAHSPTVWVNEHNRDPGTDRVSRALVELERDCFERADAVVCPSRTLGSWVAQAFGLERVEATPLPLGEMAALPAREPPAGVRRLLYVGRLEPRKGFDLLLAGFAAALGEGVDLRLDVAGSDTPDPRTKRNFGETALKRLLPRSFRSCVTLHDAVDAAGLATLRAQATAAVVPSPDDNYPYTCVEAMASGLPVIANRAGGMSEMVRDGMDGHLLTPTVQAWKESLLTIARADAFYLKMMGDAARSRINAVCGNDRVIDARVSQFAQVTARRHDAIDDDVVVVNAGSTSSEAIELLSNAARRCGGFAVGWTRRDRLKGAPSPSREWMAHVDDGVGAVCIVRSRLPDSVNDGACDDVPGLVRALLKAGTPGVVQPRAMVEGSGSRGRRPTSERELASLVPAAALRRARRR